MKEIKWLNTLGLMSRARKLITGEELVVKGIQKGTVHFVLLSEDAANNTKKKLMNKCTHYDIPYVIKGDRHSLGRAIGKEARVVLGITDEGFAKKLQSQIHSL